MATTAQSIASTLFDALANWIQQQQTEQFIHDTLVSQFSMNDAVASMIAHAIATKGEVDLDLSQPITLSQLLDPALPSGVSLPSSWAAVNIDSASFTANVTDASFAFAGAMSAPLSLAGNSCQWAAQISLSSVVTNGARDTSGMLSGALAFAQVTFDGKYQFAPGVQTFEADVQPQAGPIKLADVYNSLGTALPSLPDGMPDLSLTGARLELDMSGAKTAILYAQWMLNGTQGDVVVATSNESGKWEAGACLDLQTDLSTWPVIGASFADFPISVASAKLVVASGTITLSEEFDTETDTSTAVVMQSGVSIFAFLALSTGGNATLANLTKFLSFNNTNSNTTQLMLEAQLPAAKLTVDLGNLPLFGTSMASASLSIAAPFDFSLTGSLTFEKLNNLQFDATLAVTDEEVEGTLDLQAGQPIQLPAIPGVYIDEVGGLLGFDFDKQEATAGFEAKFNIGSSYNDPGGDAPDASALNGIMPKADGSAQNRAISTPVADRCALVMGIGVEDLVPDIDLALLQVSSIGLGDIVTALVNPPRTDLTTVLDSISLTNILVYWCDDAPGGIVMPDGSTVSPGFEFRGTINFWTMFSASADLKIKGTSCSGAFTMSPITFGSFLTITADPNGPPYITFDTGANNLLSASWLVKIVDTTQTLDVTVDRSAFQFSFSTSDLGVFTGNLTCSLDPHLQHFEFVCNAGLSFTIHLSPIAGVDLGDIPIDTSVTATVSADLTSSGADLHVSGTFTFENDSLSFSVSLDAPSTLKGLPDAIAAGIVNDADNIFSSAVNAMKGLFEKYGEDAYKFVEEVADDVKNIVESLFGIHHSHKPSWLQNGVLLKAETSDPVYELHEYRRRWVPDVQTLQALGGAYEVMADLEVASLPMDDVQVPSRVDGTIFKEINSNNLYISVSDAKGPACYQINDPATYLNAVTTVITNPVDQPSPSAGDDIGAFRSNSVLSKLCTIDMGTPERSIFFDGIRRLVADYDTYLTLIPGLQNSNTLPASAYQGILQSVYNFPSVAPGQLVKSDAGPDVYYIDTDHQLHYVSADEFAAHFEGANITTIEDACFQLFNQGGKYKG